MTSAIQSRRPSVVRAGMKKRLGDDPADWGEILHHPPAYYAQFGWECLDDTLRITRKQVTLMFEPPEAIRTLNKAKIPFVVMGLYGISGWLKDPRATDDFDVLVAMKDVKRTAKAICADFPFLTARDTPVVVRLENEGKALMDIMKPHHPLFKLALKRVGEARLHGLKVKVPTKEMALGLKYFAMTSFGRQPNAKYQDAHDFINMAKNNKGYDFAMLKELGEMAFAGGGDDLMLQFDLAVSGKMLEL